MEAHQKLRRWWDETSSEVVTSPLPLSKIQELERHYFICLPKDFNDYLLASCPTAENWDDNATNWWHFDRLRNIPDEYQHDTLNPDVNAHKSEYLFFADHAIWCWAWAISCADDENRGKIVVINGTSDHFVADNFSDFISRYISDFPSVC